jgi:Tfp pilus assembly protein PilF
LATKENSLLDPNPHAWTSGPERYRWVPPALVAALTFLIYLPTLSYQFVWDDQMQVLTNPLVSSWSTVPRVFENNLWFQITSAGSFYRPFFIVWSIFAHSLFGFDPRGWHFLNVTLHVGATVLVFFLLRELRAGYWTAVVASLFFGIHPMHVETAAWISAGADSLVTILVVLTFLAYLHSRGREQPRRPLWQIVSLVIFACALLTKEMAVMIPVMIFLYEWLFARETTQSGFWPKLRRSTLTTLPYGMLNIAYLLLRRHVLHGTLMNQQQALKSAAGTTPSVHLLATISTLPIVMVDYLRYLLYPFGLTEFYYVRPVYRFADPRFFLPLAGLVVLAGAVRYWSRREKEPLIAFFGLWLVIVLSPALYLPAFTVGAFVRDRYMYLPSIGFVFLLAKAVPLIGRALRVRQIAGAPALLVFGLSLFLVVGVITQEANWASDLLVFYRGYTLYPENIDATKYLAAALNRRDEPAKAEHLLQEAISAEPQDPYAHLTLAMVEAGLGQQQQADKELATAFALSPQYYSGSSDGLTSMGIALSALHHYPEAEQRLRQALQKEPDAVLAHFYLGLTLLRTGSAAEAEQHLRAAIRINPTIDNFHWALGLCRQMQGDSATAAQEYQEELQLHPDNKAAATSLRSLQSQASP